MRRQCNSFGSQFPPIKPEVFQMDFDAWKTKMSDTAPANSNAFDDDSLCLDSFSNSINQTQISENNDEITLLNTACTDFNDFDTQMSPSIYSDSDDGSANDNNDLANQIPNSQTDNIEQIMTPEIACNQEHAARARARRTNIKPSIQRQLRSDTTPIKRITRASVERISPYSKRLNYKQLPIKINANSKTSNGKTYLFRMKRQPKANSTALLNDSKSELF